MLRTLGAVAALGALVFASGVQACNTERKQECERFLAATKPLDQITPSGDTVDRVSKDVGAVSFTDEPLKEYARNLRSTLTVLSNVVTLQDGPSPPDGTADVVKQKLKEARTDRDDVARYCSQ